MISFAMIAALCCLASAPADSIDLHEWGVVIYSGNGVEAVGSSGGHWTNPNEMIVYAPVVYLYGPGFTGDVTVTSNGRIFNAWPEPDRSFQLMALEGGGSAVGWTGITAEQADSTESEYRSIPGDAELTNFGWALYMWRQPGSLLLTREADGFADTFLYYEVDLSGRPFPPPLPGSAPENAPADEIVSGEIMLVDRPDFDTIRNELILVERLPEGSGDVYEAHTRVGYSCELALEAIRGWAGGILTEEEIQALWGTWESFVLYGNWEGETLAVFPIPAPLIDEISKIEVTNEAGLPVSYHRFFLGMVAL